MPNLPATSLAVFAAASFAGTADSLAPKPWWAFGASLTHRFAIARSGLLAALAPALPMASSASLIWAGHC